MCRKSIWLFGTWRDSKWFSGQQPQCKIRLTLLLQSHIFSSCLDRLNSDAFMVQKGSSATTTLYRWGPSTVYSVISAHVVLVSPPWLPPAIHGIRLCVSWQLATKSLQTTFLLIPQLSPRSVLSCWWGSPGSKGWKWQSSPLVCFRETMPLCGEKILGPNLILM